MPPKWLIVTVVVVLAFGILLNILVALELRS